MTTRPTADLMLLRLADDARVMQDNVNSFELRIFMSEGHTAVRYLGDTAKDLLSLLADRARMEKALEFYRDNWDWFPVGGEQPNAVDVGSPPEGYEGEPNSALAADQGDLARQALGASQ